MLSTLPWLARPRVAGSRLLPCRAGHREQQAHPDGNLAGKGSPRLSGVWASHRVHPSATLQRPPGKARVAPAAERHACSYGERLPLRHWPGQHQPVPAAQVRNGVGTVMSKDPNLAASVLTQGGRAPVEAIQRLNKGDSPLLPPRSRLLAGAGPRQMSAFQSGRQRQQRIARSWSCSCPPRKCYTPDLFEDGG